MATRSFYGETSNHEGTATAMNTKTSHYLLLVIHQSNARAKAKRDVRFFAFRADDEESASTIARGYLVEHKIPSANIIGVALEAFDSEASMSQCLNSTFAALMTHGAQPEVVRINVVPKPKARPLCMAQ